MRSVLVPRGGPGARPLAREGGDPLPDPARVFRREPPEARLPDRAGLQGQLLLARPGRGISIAETDDALAAADLVPIWDH